MKTVTREEVSKFIADISESILKVNDLGAYKKDGKVEFYVLYDGQGLDENVYNGKYDSIVNLKETYDGWKIGEIDKETLINIVHETVQEL